MQYIKICFNYVVKYIVIMTVALFCIFSLENVYGDTKMNEKVDFKKIAQQIKKDEPRPPRYGQGKVTDVSSYFQFVVNNKNVNELKEELDKAGYYTRWEDDKNVVQTIQEAKLLTASFSFNIPIYKRFTGRYIMSRYDSLIVINFFFNDMGVVTHIKAIHFSDPH